MKNKRIFLNMPAHDCFPMSGLRHFLVKSYGLGRVLVQPNDRVAENLEIDYKTLSAHHDCTNRIYD